MWLVSYYKSSECFDLVSRTRASPLKKIGGVWSTLRSRLVSAPRYWRSNQNALWFSGLAVQMRVVIQSREQVNARNIFKGCIEKMSDTVIENFCTAMSERQVQNE